MPSLYRIFSNTRESSHEISIIRIKLNFVPPPGFSIGSASKRRQSA
jgi:hypothetical protein